MAPLFRVVSLHGSKLITLECFHHRREKVLFLMDRLSRYRLVSRILHCIQYSCQIYHLFTYRMLIHIMIFYTVLLLIKKLTTQHMKCSNRCMLMVFRDLAMLPIILKGPAHRSMEWPFEDSVTMLLKMARPCRARAMFSRRQYVL